MKIFFKITDIVYEIFGDVPRQIGSELQEYVFIDEPVGKHKIYIELKAVEEFKPLAGAPLYGNNSYLILKPDTQQMGWLEPEHRIYISKNGSFPTACYIEKNRVEDFMAGFHGKGADIVIEYLKAEHFVMDMTFMEFFSIDRHLAYEKAFIVHACYIEHENYAIIFTAPSGTGKSTQGNLWRLYAGANIINGDRCILKIEDDGSCWAHSLPFCGSSSINHNQSFELKSIVFLSQGHENVITEKVSVLLLKKLLSQTTFSIWAKEAVGEVLEFYDYFMKRVPVLQYACTPDQRAVDKLLKYFYRD